MSSQPIWWWGINRIAEALDRLRAKGISHLHHPRNQLEIRLKFRPFASASSLAGKCRSSVGRRPNTPWSPHAIPVGGGESPLRSCGRMSDDSRGSMTGLWVLVFGLVAPACAEAENPGKSSKRPAAVSTPESSKDSEREDSEPKSFEDRCGWSETVSDKALLDESMLTGIDKHFTGSQDYIVLNVPYKITVKPRLSLKTTATEALFTTEIDVTADPSDARGPAEKKVAPHRGTLSAKLLTASERSKLASGSADWSGVTCAVLPASEVTAVRGTRGATESTVKFNPALPILALAKADASTFTNELGNVRVFRNIEAEVAKTSGAAVGPKIVGSVTITRINPNLVLQQTTGKSVTIKASSAWKITHEFGSPEQTAALGLIREQLWYVDHEKREFQAIVFDSGDTKTGPFVFSNEAQIIHAN